MTFKKNIRTILMPKEKREAINFKVIHKSHIILGSGNIKRESRNEMTATMSMKLVASRYMETNR